MIVVTGAAGFIGSCLVNKLNNKGFNNLILVDDFSKKEKEPNLFGKSYAEKVERDRFFDWLKINGSKITFVFHIGARTDTAEFDKTVFDKLNVNYSKELFQFCAINGIAMIYASSAATYGMGEHGYDDSHEMVTSLSPLNPYGVSKNEFDKWVLKQKTTPPFWAGIKFFNVFGPNEYHKGRMASVIFHAYNQIKTKGEVTLFRSHKNGIADGHQKRDFIYVKDVVTVLHFLMLTQPHSGIYNLGTGKARTFLDLAKATFDALEKPKNIVFVDTPEDIRDKYQYFTEAKIMKLRNAGFDKPFFSLENAIKDYVQTYLCNKEYY